MTAFWFLVRHALHTAFGDNLVRFLPVEFKTDRILTFQKTIYHCFSVTTNCNLQCEVVIHYSLTFLKTLH